MPRHNKHPIGTRIVLVTMVLVGLFLIFAAVLPPEDKQAGLPFISVESR